jgi:hypothetical protein
LRGGSGGRRKACAARLVGQLRHAVEAASGDGGWAALAYVGQILTNRSPDLDSRTWVYAKLSDLVIATKLFDVESRGSGDGKPGVIFVREKRRPSSSRPSSSRQGSSPPGGTRRGSAKAEEPSG